MISSAYCTSTLSTRQPTQPTTAPTHTSRFKMWMFIKTQALFVAILLILLCSADACITLYDRAAYFGSRVTFCSSKKALPSYFNNRATSAKVTKDQIWLLYDHKDYKGKVIVVQRNKLFLTGLNNRASSLERVA